MQVNPPFGSFGFQSYSKTVPPPIPQIVGEGDVTAITFPDGSAQFYFVPTVKQLHYPCVCTVNNHYGSLFPGPPIAEVWFVRSITHPQANLNICSPPGNFNSQYSSKFGECPPYTPNCCMDTYPPTKQEYTQKFHNDNLTSTTDIHYFYPSLRPAKCLQYSTATQTETPCSHNNVGPSGGRDRPCYCEPRSHHEPVNIELRCHPKVPIKFCDSCMSVDSATSKSGQKKDIICKKKSARSKEAIKEKHICECEMGTRRTSDKFVMTYADQATGNIAKEGQQSQTETKKKQKSRATKKKRTLKWSSSSQSLSGSCSCKL